MHETSSVLIIGGTSVVGRALGDRLKDDYEVLYAGRNSGDITFDLETPELVQPVSLLMPVDVVVIVAAAFGGNEQEDYRTALVNGPGVLKACRLAVVLKAKHLLLVSSLSALDQPGDPYFGFYGLTKRHGEELAQLYCSAQDLPLTILRPSQLYDADSRCRRHQAMFYHLIDKAEAGEDVTIYGKRDAVRNLVYLDDFVDWVSLVIKASIAGQYNCIGITTTLEEIANTAFDIFGSGGQVVYDHAQDDVPDLNVPDSHLLTARVTELKFTSLAAGIAAIKQARS